MLYKVVIHLFLAHVDKILSKTDRKIGQLSGGELERRRTRYNAGTASEN